jgi:penicillin V acylase-like amidase (Ntn superfamily)
VTPSSGDKRLPLSFLLWTYYVLDNFGTVGEAVSALRLEPLCVVVPMVTPGYRSGSAQRKKCIDSNYIRI